MRRSSATLLALCCAAPTIAVLAATPASAATFTPGNVVVEQVGATGSASAQTSAATAIFLDEYTGAANQLTPVQQIALPTVQTGTSLPVTASGTATSEGQITNSGDGQTILVPGYDATPGTQYMGGSITGSTAASTPRVLARVGSGGLVDSTTSTNNAFDTNNIRSVTSAYLNGTETDIAVGANTGVVTETEGQSSSTTLSSTNTNLRVAHVYSGQIFYSTGSGTAGVYVLSATSGAATASLVPGTNGTSSPYGFAFARTGTGTTYAVNGVDTGLDTLYVADSSAGLTKYVWSGSTFVKQGAAQAGAFYGLAARTGATGEDVYVTTASKLESLNDPSGGGALTTATPVTVATAPANTSFRGVAFTAPAPGTSLPEAPYAVLLPLIGISALGVVAMRRSARR